MNNEVRLEIALHTLRLASNMITEVQANHIGRISQEASKEVRDAISALHRADSILWRLSPTK